MIEYKSKQEIVSVNIHIRQFKCYYACGLSYLKTPTATLCGHYLSTLLFNVEYHERACVRCTGSVSIYSNIRFTPSLYFRLLLVSSAYTALSLVIRIRRISYIYIPCILSRTPQSLWSNLWGVSTIHGLSYIRLYSLYYLDWHCVSVRSSSNLSDSVL
jgi:hypothetical protein